MGQESRASPSRGVMQWGGEVENDADSDDGVSGRDNAGNRMDRG